MKDQFKEHYEYSEDEVEKLWDNAYFVFDTNTLLNMYRYDQGTFKEYVKVLKELAKSKKLFLPNHVGEEFFRNRMKVIQDYKKSYDELLKMTAKFKEQLASKYRHHPFVDIQKLGQDINKALKPAEKEVKDKQSNHPDLIKEDGILVELTAIFSECTGEPFNDEEKSKIFKEGETRYEKKIPPGFKDADKGGDRQYGDLIVWKQMIAFAKENKKPIVFITADEKEDWWLLNEGERLMPLPSLKREMRLEAGVDFHAYTADYFLETYNTRNKSSIDMRAIEEVRKVRQIQDLMEPEDTYFKKHITFSNGSDERYELFVITISKFFEILDHVQHLVHDESYDMVSRLDYVESSMRTISRMIRAAGKVNNFHLRKVLSLLEKTEIIFKDQSLKASDEMLTKRLDAYSAEMNKMRRLLEREEYVS